MMRHSALYKLPDPEFVFGHGAPRELTCGWLASNPVQVTLSGDELGAGDLDGLLHRQGVPADMILGRTGLTNMRRGDCGRTFHALSRDRTRLQPTLSSSGPRVDRLSVRDVGRPDRGELQMVVSLGTSCPTDSTSPTCAPVPGSSSNSRGVARSGRSPCGRKSNRARP